MTIHARELASDRRRQAVPELEQVRIDQVRKGKSVKVDLVPLNRIIAK